MEEQPDASTAIRQAGFVGEYPHTLDAKHRVLLPAELRGPLVGAAVAVRWDGPCVALFTRAGYDAVVDNIRTVPRADDQFQPGADRPNPSASLRYISRGTRSVAPDPQGRFVLPEFLRAHARIERDVIVLGVRDRVELWRPDLLDAEDQAGGPTVDLYMTTHDYRDPDS